MLKIDDDDMLKMNLAPLPQKEFVPKISCF